MTETDKKIKAEELMKKHIYLKGQLDAFERFIKFDHCLQERNKFLSDWLETQKYNLLEEITFLEREAAE